MILIFMDLQMPEMDGFETTEEIRKGSAGIDHITIPIIALTADTTEVTKERIIVHWRRRSYSPKPVNGELLKETAFRILEECSTKI